MFQRKYLNLIDVQNKTIQSIYKTYDSLIITFSDQTFIFLSAFIEYDDAVLSAEEDFKPLEFNKERLIATGVITEEEYNEAYKVYEDKLKAKRLQTFNELKKEFEP